MPSFFNPRLRRCFSRHFPQFLLVIASLPLSAGLFAQTAPPPNVILWTDPGEIHARNLLYGVGGEKHQPKPPFAYVKEDTGGTSPKFEVSDSTGEKWKAKMGPESQAEVAASRLLWAVGYSANENYYESEIKVPGAHTQQHRGRKFIAGDDEVHGVRLQRNPPGEKKDGDWDWKKNPFVGTREFNGLRVMMALLSNWDLKDDNNAVYDEKDEPSKKVYGVTDVGATFGSSGKSFPDSKSKNNLEMYRGRKFVAKVTDQSVDFNFPTRPAIVYYFFAPPFVLRSRHFYWIGRHIPRPDVQWIAGLLSQLSHDQVRDAFRAAGYAPQQVDAYTTEVESRIAELKKL
jgi:hypothetical protein